MTDSLEDGDLHQDELPDKYTPTIQPDWCATTDGQVTEYTVDDYAEFEFYGAYIEDEEFADAWISSDLFYSFEQAR